jgi:outer membrane protein OmpA-like peptidoglycan-associated protein
MKTRHTLIAALVASVALTACGGAPKKIDSLEQARSAYDRAAADPSVARHAPKELDAAKLALGKADRDWREEESKSRVETNANLALKRVKTAELIAQSREDQDATEAMKLERQRVQLDLRSAEVERSRAEAEEARLAAAKMQQQLEDLKAERTERGMVLTLGDVLFASNEAVLAPGAARNIQQIASFLESYPDRDVIVEGHTDSFGDEDYNLDLSRERAFAVRQALVAQGIPAYRISTQGFGETVPVASNQSSAGRQQNRRVEVIFPDGPGQVSELSQ